MPERTNPNPRRILLVDDEASTRTMLRAALEKAGFEVLDCANGVEAARVIDCESIDVLLTDVLMPEGDGIELIRRARKAPSGSEVRIIAMSGGSPRLGMEPLGDAKMLGADCTLPKPFGIDDLMQTIDSVCPPTV